MKIGQHVLKNNIKLHKFKYMHLILRCRQHILPTIKKSVKQIKYTLQSEQINQICLNTDKEKT